MFSASQNIVTLATAQGPRISHSWELIDRRTLADGQVFSAYYHRRLAMLVTHRPWVHSQGAFALQFSGCNDSDKGTSHATEHMIFRGSETLLAKEPFSIYSRWSPALEINASTQPDGITLYASSHDMRDLLDIFRMNVDAAFFALMRKNAYLEEVCRLVKTLSDGKPALSGVLINEVRGDGDQNSEQLVLGMMRALFPDTYHAFDYAGDPNAVPFLSLEEVTAWMTAHLHPSNANLAVTGKAPIEPFLEMLDEVLPRFAPRVIPSFNVQQRPFEQTIFRDLRCTGINSHTTSVNQPLIGLGIARPEARSSVHRLQRVILDHALLAHETSPLNEHMRAELSGYALQGYSVPFAPTEVFMASACGPKAVGHRRFERVVQEGLEQSFTFNGLPRLLQYSTNALSRDARLERESLSGPGDMAYELAAELPSMRKTFDFEALIAVDPGSALRRAGTALQDNISDVRLHLVGQELLANKHRAAVRVLPDSRVNRKILSRERDIIDTLLKTHEPEELTYHQAGRAESREAVEELTEMFFSKPAPFSGGFELIPSQNQSHSVFVSPEAIECHAALLFNLRPVAFEHLPAFIFYLSIIPFELECRGLDEHISVSWEFDFVEKDGELLASAFLNLSSEVARAAEIWALFETIVQSAPVPEVDQIAPLLEEALMEHLQSIVDSPSDFAARHAEGRVSRAAALDELWDGIEYEKELRKMLAMKPEALHALFVYFAEWLAAQHPVAVGVVAPQPCPPPENFLHQTSGYSTVAPLPPWLPDFTPPKRDQDRHETLPYIASVGALGVAIPLDVDPAIGNVIAHYLRTIGLQDKVRRRAGAYRVRATFDREAKILGIVVGDVRDFERAEKEVAKALEDIELISEAGVFEALQCGAAAYLINELELADRLGEELLQLHKLRDETRHQLAERVRTLVGFPYAEIRNALGKAIDQAYWVRFGVLPE